MVCRVSFLLMTLLLGGCSDGGGLRSDGAVDRGIPDAPVVKLDQQPIPVETGADAPLPDMAQATVLAAPFFLDFDQDDGRLVGTRDWEWGQLSFLAGKNCDSSTYYAPSLGHSGMGMWGTKLNDCYSPLNNAQAACSNEDLVDDSVLTVKVSLPATLPNPRLTYWEWADYFLAFDWTEVRIDGSVTQQSCTGSLPVPPKWEKRSIDLKQWAGRTITITFHFMASSVVNRSGWYIDDMAVNSD